MGASQQEFSWTEAHLVDAVRAGDERAFEALYERYGGRIFAYVLGMVGDHGRAEDITQDVFLSALRRMCCTDRAISFKPWIYEIAKNACIDEFRRVARAREVPIEQGRAEQLVSNAPSPDSRVEQRQKLDALHGAFRGLSERQHTVIVLRELEGLTYTEIAARTGMTLPMVESTLLRARRRLSEEYDDIASGRRCEQVLAVVEGGGQAAVDALGLRERRRFARHIAHCQPCARHARMAGVTEPHTRLPPLVKKIAGLLPFPLTRWPFSWGRHAGSRSYASAPLRSARKAAQFVHPGASVGASPATMAAAVIAAGGTAVGLVSPWHTSGARGAPATVNSRPAAVTRTLRDSPHKASRPFQRAARVMRPPNHPAGAAPPASLRSGQAHNSTGSSSAAVQMSTAAGAAKASLPSAPRPPLPSTSPRVRSVKHLLDTVTNPVHKVVKQVGHAVTNPLTRTAKKVLPGPLLRRRTGLARGALEGIEGSSQRRD